MCCCPSCVCGDWGNLGHVGMYTLGALGLGTLLVPGAIPNPGHHLLCVLRSWIVSSTRWCTWLSTWSGTPPS